MQRRALIAIAIAACAPTRAPGAMIVDDPSFFTGRPHTYLDFETRGDGSPVGLAFLGFEYFEANEYVRQGIRFEGGAYLWDSVPAPVIGTPLDPRGLGGLGDAVAAIGTVPTVYGATAGSEIHFLDEVHSFGIGVVQRGFPYPYAPDPDNTTTLVAFDAAGVEIGRVRLWDEMIDGGFGATYAGGAFGDRWRSYQYGFLGLASETPIAFVRFENNTETLFDSFYYSAIPAPGSGAMLALGGVCAMMRRRCR